MLSVPELGYCESIKRDTVGVCASAGEARTARRTKLARDCMVGKYLGGRDRSLSQLSFHLPTHGNFYRPSIEPGPLAMAMVGETTRHESKHGAIHVLVAWALPELGLVLSPPESLND
jgi:hypothetical protein